MHSKQSQVLFVDGPQWDFKWKARARLTDWSIPRLLFLVDEDEVDLALPVREEGGGGVLAPDQVQVHRSGRGVPRGPRVRRRGVLQDLRGNEKRMLSLEP